MNAALRTWLARCTAARMLLVLVGLGLLWRVARWAWGFPIWGDEAFVAVNFVTRDYADLVRPLDYGQIAPLVFMWVELAVSRLLGLSERALHLVPTLAGLATVLLFWRFSQQVVPRRAAMLATGILAASYYVVRHGAELKPYATDLLISLALTMLVWRVWQQPRNAARWAVLVFAGGAAGWCSYPAAFVLVAAGAVLTWLLVRERLRTSTLVGWLAFGVATGGSLAAMYFVYAQPHAEAASRLTEISMWAKTFPPLDDLAKFPLWLFGIHAGLMLAYPHGGTAPGSIATLLLVIGGAVMLARRNGPLVLLLLGPLVPTFAAAAVKAYPYGGSARTSLYMAPAFCLLAGIGLHYLLSRLQRLGARSADGRVVPASRRPFPLRASLPVTLAALCGLPLGGMIGDAVRPYQSLESHKSRAAVQQLAAQARRGDRWVVFNSPERVGYAPWLGESRGVGGQFVFDVLRLHPVPLDWAPPADAISADAGRVWLLSYRGPKAPWPEELLTTYVAKLTARLGPPTHERHVIKTKKEGVEALDVHCFAPAGVSAIKSMRNPQITRMDAISARTPAPPTSRRPRPACPGSQRHRRSCWSGRSEV